MYKKNFFMDKMISSQNSNEYVNSISHLIGAILAIIGTVVLIVFSAQDAKWLHLVSFCIYGLTLFLSSLFSTILHFFLLFERYKRVLGILDDSAIYLLIAGTYTPFCLIGLNKAHGWLLFSIVWGLAILFIALKAIFFVRLSPKLSLASYIVMGWVLLPFVPTLISTIGIKGLILLILSGLFYSIGGLIFLKEKPDPWPPYFGNHEIWHICVLIAHAIMYAALLIYVLPINLNS